MSLLGTRLRVERKSWRLKQVTSPVQIVIFVRLGGDGLVYSPAWMSEGILRWSVLFE